jgi:hypothetical protein
MPCRPRRVFYVMTRPGSTTERRPRLPIDPRVALCFGQGRGEWRRGTRPRLCGCAKEGARLFTSGLIEWFWRGSKLARAKRESHELTERAATCVGRARASAELAQIVLSADDAEESHFGAHACELYRQSAYWSLVGLTEGSGAEAHLSYDPAVWDAVEPSLLARASSEARADRLHGALRGGTFVQFVALSRPEQVRLRGELRTLAQALLAKLDRRAELFGTIYLQRVVRLGALGVLTLALVGGAVQVSRVVERRSDLANGRAWQASSRFGTSGCTSPAQRCRRATGFFFHTDEEDNPWLELDLGAPNDVSRVDVTNRTDCCRERGYPLVIEVSSDHESWRPVARRDTEFSHWTARFSPVQARWVRLRLLKRSYLHLSDVAIH